MPESSPLQAFHRATLAILAAPSLRVLLQTAVQQAVDLTGAAHGSLTVNADALGHPPETPDLPENQAVQRRPDWITVRSGAADVSATQMEAPLFLRDRVIGTLRVHVAAIDASTEHTRQLLVMLGEQVVVALEQARLFEQLQLAKDEWEAIFDGLVYGVYTCRPNGVILRANRALAEMMGLEMEEILGHCREDLHVRLPDYQVLRPWQRVKRGPTGLDMSSTEFRFGTPERVFVETMFSLRADSGPWSGSREHRDDTGRDDVRHNGAGSGGEGRCVCILRDITEQRRLQEQLLQSEKLAALGELLSGVAHELNNPLATVVGYAQLLEGEAALPANMRRQMHTIHQEAVRASHIVQNLLTFARRSAPDKKHLDMNNVLRAVVEMRTYQFQADNVRMLLDYGHNLPAVLGDASELQQVFLNIINNAAHAVREWRGGGEIRITTQAVPVDGKAGVRVTIADNGPGIAPDHLRRVFDPFFTTKAAGQGTGLGMSISLKIVSNHNGRIWAESRLGHGAHFFVELPAANEKAEVEAPPLAAPAAPDRVGPRRQILVVDDEEPIVMLLTEILTMDGHQVTPAYNGAEALALVQARDFDLILSDVRMPAVGGPTFFEVLQTTRPDLLPRVMFVTGDTVSKSTQAFLQKAGRPVLAKPFEPERLRVMVAENLRLNQKLPS